MGLAAAGFCAAALLGGTAMSAAADDTPQLPTAQQLFRILTPQVVEASGVAVAPDGLIYTFNDAGNPPVIYGYDAKGNQRTQVTIPSKNVDWEDMAISNVHGTWQVTLADTGDDYLGRKDAGLTPRTTYALVRFDVPAAPAGTDLVKETATNVQRFTMVFADHANHNGETMLVQPDTGQVYIADKVYQPGDTAYLWEAPAKLSTTEDNVMTKVGVIPIQAASGGAWAEDGSRIVIRNGGSAYLWNIGNKQTMADAIKAPPVELQLPHQPQGEGVTFSQDGTGLLLTSEGDKQPVWKVDLPALLRPAAWTAPPKPPSEAAIAAAGGDQASKWPVLATAVGGLVVLVGVGLGLESRRRRR